MHVDIELKKLLWKKPGQWAGHHASYATEKTNVIDNQ